MREARSERLKEQNEDTISLAGFSMPSWASHAVMAGTVMLGLLGCSADRSHLPEKPDIPTVDGIKIGEAGDAHLFIKEINGRKFLVFDGFHSTGIVEHVSNRPDSSDKSGYTVEIQQVKDSDDKRFYYQIEVDGEKYIFVDGYKSGGITKISSAKEETKSENR